MEDKKVETIDRKFEFMATNPCNGKIYSHEDAMVFVAKDAAVPAMLEAYVDKCKALECDENHIESVRLLINRVLDFQSAIESKVPDTDLPCEIERCIHGKMVRVHGKR